MEKEPFTDFLQLPLWPEVKRGTPNSFLRSALFAAIQSKNRVFMKQAMLASQQGVTIRFTGEQLNQEDLSVWETLVHMARHHPLGHIYDFSAHQALQALGLPTGGTNHKTLNAIIDRLTACNVIISQGGKTYGGSLIEAWLHDEATERYQLRINRDMLKLFGDSQWTAIDWQQRKKLRRMPLALALHAHYSTHREPVPYKIETLYAYTGSRNKTMRSFKQQLKKALPELVKIGFLKSFSLDENDLLTVIRARH